MKWGSTKALHMERRLCTRWRNWKLLKKYLFVIAFVLTAGLLATTTINDSLTSSKFNWRMNYYGKILYESGSEAKDVKFSPDCNQVVRLAVCVRSVDDARQAATMLKTVIRRRTVAIDLHVIIGSEMTFNAMHTLLSTWELSNLNFTVYKAPKKLVNDRLWPMVKFSLHEILPVTLNQVLVIPLKLRLLDDVKHLWQQVFGFQTTEDSLENSHLAASSDGAKKCEKMSDCGMSDPFGINLKILRQSMKNSSVSLMSSTANLTAYWSLARTSLSATVPCGWSIPNNSPLNGTSCLPVRGVLWNGDSVLSHTGNTLFDAANEAVVNIAKSYPIDDGLLYSSKCSSSKSDAAVSAVVSDRDCGQFRQAALLKRRTHPFFVIGNGDDENTSERTSSDINNVDVTLATQLTIDRFAALERMLTSWSGPASVALHVTDEEAERLPSLITSSRALQKRKRVSYHVIYKRLLLNPINYLRNVAVNNSRTSFTFYVDVDLIPNVEIYNQLKTWIKRLIVDNKNSSQDLALIVPSYSSEEMIAIPPNKTELIKLIAEDKVSGYRMKRGWNLGHKPTDFDRWKRVNEPYCVKYSDAFEPYVVVRTYSSPRFNELLFERFADKALYIRTLHAHGYNLCVLPDVFVLHLPHAVSDVFKIQSTVRNYQRCASIISEEYKAELATRYPAIKF